LGLPAAVAERPASKQRTLLLGWEILDKLQDAQTTIAAPAIDQTLQLANLFCEIFNPMIIFRMGVWVTS
jgi:hypothetical protein